jgi:Methyltransferase domain
MTAELTNQIVLDYPVRTRPRYGWGQPDHHELTRILDAGRDRYRSLLLDCMLHVERLATIAVEDGAEDGEPRWINGYLPGLDAVVLYGQIARLRPKRYLEVGSGNSTKFVRRCIRDHGLNTRITSIDPHPRAEIDRLCDTVVRQPLEEIDPSVVDSLEPGDVLFIDGSHRVFMNSDVVVAFLELLPRLVPDIHVHVHDIWIPSDYPPGWADRFYSEQYLIAAQLLAGATRFEVELPSWFVTNDRELSFLLLPLWERPHLSRVERHGCSIWLRTT